MKIARLFLVAYLTIFLAAPLSAAEPDNWVTRFLKRYHPSASSAAQTAPGTAAPTNPIAAMLQTGTVPIGMTDLVYLMLDQNLNIQANRLAPRSSYYSMLVFYGALEPSLNFTGTIQRNTTPANSQFNAPSGTTVARINGFTYVTQLTDNFSTNLSQYLASGTTLGVNVSMNRLNSNSNNVLFNPSWTGRVTYTAAQHLLLNRGSNINKYQIMLGENTEKMAEGTFEQQLNTLITTAEKSYWDLVFATENLKIAQGSLALSQKTLDDNQTRVDIGTMAQIDVIQSKSDVANKKDAMVTTTFAVTTAEDQIKKLISGDKSPSLFLMKFTPKDMPQAASSVQVPALEEAVKIALENRPEMKNALRDMQNKDLGVDYYANQKKPLFDIIGTFTQNGLGGTKPANTATGAVAIPGGLWQGFDNLFNFGFKGYSLGFNFTMPLNNKAAIANYDKAVNDRATSQANLAAIGQQILLDVRNALQNVELNRARIDTAQTALDLQQQTLDAEKTKFDLGTSTLTFVLTQQNNLALSQTALLQTKINFAKSLIDLDNAMGVLLQHNNIDLDKALNNSKLAQYKPLSSTAPAGSNQ
jgi:outer membrane protein TolC